MSENAPELKVFEKNDRVEVTELFKKDSLIPGATIKGTVISSDPDYIEMITDDGLISYMRTRHLQKIEPTIIVVGDED